MRFPPLRLSLLVWGLAAVFYLFGFFQRVTPAVIAGDLMRDFALTAAALGNLSAFYFYAYAAMQIPTGILVDRLGPSRLFFAGAILSGLGALMFALAESVLVAGLGRALIGASHGLAWVSMLTLATHWFPSARFGTMSGLSLAVGTLGAVLAGPPLRWLADDFGWRSVIAASGGVALLLAVAIRIWMRDDPLDRRYMSYAPPSAHARVRRAHGDHPAILPLLGQAMRYRNPLLIFWVNSGICGAFLAFTGLWGVPFLVQQHGLAVKQASLVTSGMLVVFAISGPVWGMLSDRWKLRKRPFVLGAGLTAGGFAALAAFPAAPLPLLVACLLAAAFGAGAMVLSFGYAKESVPAPVQGAVTGLVNAGVMFGTLVQMPVIGLILDYYWQGVVVDGVRQYGLEAFQAGLLFLAGWIVVSFLLLLATRETHARAAH
ncbi:MAG: MFS transporter [Betaproteobacteria bacterium]